MDTLSVLRRFFTDKSTVGELSFQGQFLCHTLEDTCRRDAVKVDGATAIPSGRYRLVIEWSPRFQRQMPRLLNVPNFDGILIHSGNTDQDTRGCLLVGVYDPTLPDFISHSRETFETLFSRLTLLNEKNAEMWISINGSRSWLT